MYNIKFTDLIKKNSNPNKSWIFMDHHPVMLNPCEEIIGNEFSKEDIYYLKRMVNYIEISFLDKAKKYNIRPGVAIAANQVGWNKRATYIHFKDSNQIEHQYLLINPKITHRSMNKAFLSTGEGCLSVHPDQPGYVIRDQEITVQGYNLVSESYIEKTFTGFIAMCVQHELDHLDGRLYYHRINKDDKFKKEALWEEIKR
ncbi:peptide deformylase [Ureaplasma canigenitalium]|uniref:peptide deformylase n=1 Tax=Ureaplasma canigenitalium TaxID=42092 RepID=UPI0004E115FD|nr:peptide deformylase [Ureaplasma canigenitalium]